MKKDIVFKNQVMVEGMMTFDMLETGLHTLDFECCEDVETKPFRGVFSVQCMRDGNVYMTEQKKRQRNKPIFRDDNSSLSLGQNGRYYFVFTLDKEQLDKLPQQLVRQASAIAQKVLREMVNA